MEKKKGLEEQTSKGIDRRDFLKTAGAVGICAGVFGGVGKEILGAKTVFAQVKNPIKIGCVFPLSGGLELQGEQEVDGAKAAVAEINEAGGVLGRKIEVIIEDDKTDPKTSIEKTRKLIMRDQVTALLGPVTSASRDAMLPTITELKTPLMYPMDYEGGCCNRYVYCYAPLPSQFVSPFIPWLIENYGKRFYLYGTDYVWPHDMNKAVKPVLKEAGGILLAEEYTPMGVKDFASVIRKISDQNPNVLFFTVIGADSITFIKQAHGFGFMKKCVIAQLGLNDNYVAALTKEQAEGMVTPSHFFESLDIAVAKDFVARIKKRLGQKAVVSHVLEYGYTATHLLAKGIEKADSLDKEKIVDSLGDTAFTAPNGNIILRKDHHTVFNMRIAKVVDGKLREMKYLGPIVPPEQCKGKLG